MEPSLNLRDIHLPDAMSIWPPALGWWLLLILIPILIVTGWFLFKRLTRRTALKGARSLLVDIKQQAAGDKRQTIRALSHCLRRFHMSNGQREQVAGLSGQAWLLYLDGLVDGTPFSDGIGRCLVDAPYQKTIADDVDINALIELCETTLKGQNR